MLVSNSVYAVDANKTVVFDGKEARLNILNQERLSQEAELNTAKIMQATAQDRLASQKDIERITLNIKMINEELGRAQNQVVTVIKTQAQTSNNEPSRVNISAKNQVKEVVIGNEVGGEQYESWDVFKNFKRQ